MYAYLWDRINQLQQELEALKKENEEIRRKLDSIQPLRIDKIDYKVQELHVEQLSGALNIGLTLKGDEDSIMGIVDKLKNETDSQIDLAEATGEKPFWEEKSSIPVKKESSSSGEQEPGKGTAPPPQKGDSDSP
ncbi:spore germination protein GerPC [Salinithrix halophila]|uniref:Spore germination protein GerPC n=1 Tax=Salinithrix halophila TaxID=1485204 RepID=A0ABV8JH52_9BACL